MCRRIDTFINMPMQIIMHKTLEPPYEMSGKVIPTTGAQRTTMAELTTICQKNTVAIPTANNMPNRSRAECAMWSAYIKSAKYNKNKAKTPIKPYSSAQLASAKSFSGSGTNPF